MVLRIIRKQSFWSSVALTFLASIIMLQLSGSYSSQHKGRRGKKNPQSFFVIFLSTYMQYFLSMLLDRFCYMVSPSCAATEAGKYLYSSKAQLSQGSILKEKENRFQRTAGSMPQCKQKNILEYNQPPVFIFVLLFKTHIILCSTLQNFTPFSVFQKHF